MVSTGRPEMSPGPMNSFFNTTTCGFTKEIESESDLASSLQGIQRTEEHMELYHQAAIISTETRANTTGKGKKWRNYQPKKT